MEEFDKSFSHFRDEADVKEGELFKKVDVPDGEIWYVEKAECTSNSWDDTVDIEIGVVDSNTLEEYPEVTDTGNILSQYTEAYAVQFHDVSVQDHNSTDIGEYAYGGDSILVKPAGDNDDSGNGGEALTNVKIRRVV